MMQNVLERRIGNFYIPFDYIEKDPFAVMKIMGTLLFLKLILK